MTVVSPLNYIAFLFMSPLVLLCIYVHAHMQTILFTQNGVSVLYSASEQGYTEVVDALLKSGVDPNLATTVWGLVRSFHVLTYVGCSSACTYLRQAETTHSTYVS